MSEYNKGDKLLLSGGGYWWGRSAYISTVERTTKTQVITRRDERFNIKSGRRVGDHTGNIIRVASKEDVFNIHKDNLLSTSLSELNSLTSGCNNDILKHIEEIIIVANKVRR